uniref:CNH domain-containing protein n=1 Tax=Heterorhabditis bacteriophora TaxID=37862 RepID=A0A1I7X875_HETBA
MEILDEMDSENSLRLRSLNDQMVSNPDLTTVQLNVATAWLHYSNSPLFHFHYQFSSFALLPLFLGNAPTAPQPSGYAQVINLADRKTRKRKIRSQKSLDMLSRHETLLDLNSSGESSDSSSDETASGQTTVWIGNDDGEVFVVNSTERVRTRARDRVARLLNPVTAIAAVKSSVYIATASTSEVQLFRFQTLPDRTWDLESPAVIAHSLSSPMLALAPIGRRLVIASGHRIHVIDTECGEWETPVDVVSPSDSLTLMASAGSSLFVCGRRSTTVHVVDAFSLQVVKTVNGKNNRKASEFEYLNTIGREDILREHKMGCLRVSCLTTARAHVWIGTSAGYIISTPIYCAKAQLSPPLTVCEIGHSGPCRVIIPINVALSRRMKRMSLNVPAQQASQVNSILFLLSFHLTSSHQHLASKYLQGTCLEVTHDGPQLVFTYLLPRFD